MLPRAAHFWMGAPALRLLIPFMMGIVVQWYYPLPLLALLVSGLILLLASLLYHVLSLPKKFRLAPLSGLLLSLLTGVIGAGAVYRHDIRNHPQWLGNHSGKNRTLLVRLDEPLVEKTASWKALVSVQSIGTTKDMVAAEGKLILYFKKDSLPPALSHGSQVVINKPVESIRSSGNPGTFDYRRYCLFAGITHQVYLTRNDYGVLAAKEKNPLYDRLFHSRQAIIRTLQTYIPRAKEQGLAEALLIGYRDDLDKSLQLSYSNTGVVHVIAISGLHVGLIYWLLLGLSRPLKRKGLLGVRLLVLVAGLWGFGLLAGAQASVMRSVVMFSFLAGADVLGRRTSVYNTLALSAFLLLCYNPFWLWDVGFQLSYAAVGSILLFYRPISGWIYFPNKAFDYGWKMTAVTLSAQVFTTPLVLYHFHQFPNLFLFTNLVAVPLSSLVLLGEIGLCAVAFLPSLAIVVGRVLSGLIGYMNTFIEQMDNVSFAVWSGISISVVQTVLLTAGIGAAAGWLMEQRKAALAIALGCAVLFLGLRTGSFWQAEQQRKLIVYNVPKHRAIDVIEGRRYRYIGEAAVQDNALLRTYNLQPSRVLHRLPPTAPPTHLHSFTWSGQKVLLIDSTVQLKKEAAPHGVDLLILSGNPKVYMTTMVHLFQPRQVVVDASVPHWKARLWKRDCRALRIPFYAVEEKGAFVVSR